MTTDSSGVWASIAVAAALFLAFVVLIELITRYPKVRRVVGNRWLFAVYVVFSVTWTAWRWR